MRRIAIAGWAVGLAAVTVTPAAADGPVRDYTYRYNNAVHADGVDWSGLYSGIHSGGVTGKTTFVRTSFTPSSPSASAVSCCSSLASLISYANDYRLHEYQNSIERTVDIDGFHIGPHIGYQRQFGHIVLGGDLGFSVGGGDGEKDCSDPDVAPISVRCESEYKYSFNARGRIGYARGSYLFYLMGGVTRAKIENRVRFSMDGASFSESGSAYPNGIIAGLGIDYQDARGMRWGISYTHLFLEDVTVNLNDPFAGGSATRTTPDPDVLGATLKIPLQSQAAAVPDPGPPAAQAPAVAQAQVPPQAPAAQPAAQPSAPRATTPPAARTPVPGTPMEPGEPAPKGRPSK